MNTYLIRLEWPEKCFRADAEALRYFRTLVPRGSRIIRARSEGEFLKALPKATHAVVWDFKQEWFQLAPSLRLLATPAAGREFLPTSGPEGVKIHFGSFHGAIMAETVLAFVLAWSHGFFFKCPLWPRSNLAGRCIDVAGTRALVAGYGKVGRAIGDKLAAFGVEVYGVTRHGIFSPDGGKSAFTPKRLASLAAKADWLVMALPGDTGTDDFLDAELISKLPSRCVVVNVGRGNSVDERALLKALKEKRLAGAYLDVFKNEPTVLNAGRRRAPGVLAEGKNLPGNLIRMPHASAFSPSYIKMCFKELKDEGLI